MKTGENGTTEIDLLTRLKFHPGSDLWPLRLFHPFILKSFPWPFSSSSSSSAPSPGKNTLPPESGVDLLPSFLSSVLANSNSSKMAKLYGISGEHIRQYQDILLSQNIRDIRSPQDIQSIQEARTSEDTKSGINPCQYPCQQDDLHSTMSLRYDVNFHDVRLHTPGKVPEGLRQTVGPQDRDSATEGSYSDQGYLGCSSRRLGSESYRDLNVSGMEKSTEATSATGDFYSAGNEEFMRTVTSPSSFLASRESCHDDDVIEDPPRSNEEDRNKIDELDQLDLSYDDPNTSKGSDGERKEESFESPNEEKTYSCPVCAFTTTDSLVFLPHVIHHCRQPRVGGPPYNPEDRKRRLSGGGGGGGGQLSQQPMGSSRKKGFHCKKCNFESEDKDVYYEHLASHIKIESRYSCVLCSFVTGLRHHITYHICNHYGIKSIRCHIDKCNYVCINQSMLKSHLKKHPLQACTRCHFTTKSNSEAEKHVRETDHSMEMGLRRPDETNFQHSGSFGSQEAPGRFYGAHHQTGLASRPERSFGVPLPAYLNPAAMAGNSFLHGLVSPMMWPPGAMAADGRGVMSQNAGHAFQNLGVDVSPSFPQSLMSQKQWAGQFASASDLYHQFLSFQKSFPSATVPPVSGFPPPSTRIQDSMQNSKKRLLSGYSFNEASIENVVQTSVSGNLDLFQSQNMSQGGQRFLQDVPQRRENTTALDLTKSQPLSENTNTQISGNRPFSDPTVREQKLSETKTSSCDDTAMLRPSKFCRRKGVARKVVVDEGSEESAMGHRLGISNCENMGRASSDGRPWSNGRPLSNGRPSSEGCVTSLVFDLWHTRPSQTGESSPESEDRGHGSSALLDLISASENLLPAESKPLRVEDRVTQAPGCKQRRSPVSKESNAKRESKISRSPTAQKPVNTYDCGHCGIRFQDYILYSMHSGYHNFNDPLQCNFCGRKYDNFYEFYEHIGKVEHPES